MTNHEILAPHLIALLYDLELVEESARYHPEENALVHSLQTFELAKKNTARQDLIASALFHDIGKSLALRNHAYLGAELLRGLLPDYVVWLVEHHMDLLYHPRRTRDSLRHSSQLEDLELLRRWDSQSRVPNAPVPSVEYAVDYIFRGGLFLNQP